MELTETGIAASAEFDESQREGLILSHLPHVAFVARCIHTGLPPHVLLEDLVNAGVLGLMDAVRRYDPEKKVHFKSYAEFRIRGAILDSLRQQDWSPRTLRRQGRQLKNAIANCEARGGREPTEQEIADELRMGLDNLQRLLRDLRNLEIEVLPDNGSEMASDGDRLNQCSRANENDPYFCTLRNEMTGLLMKTIEELPARERDVLTLYHFGELSMKAVGSALGIGESRVSQIHTAALAHLRTRLVKILGCDFNATGDDIVLDANLDVCGEMHRIGPKASLNATKSN